MAHALLRAVARLHHGRRDARNAKATLVVIAHGLLKLGQVAQSVLPHLGVLGRLRERLDHVVVRLKIGRSHAHVVNGLALSLQREELVVERGKYLCAKAVETLRCLHGATFRYKKRGAPTRAPRDTGHQIAKVYRLQTPYWFNLANLSQSD